MTQVNEAQIKAVAESIRVSQLHDVGINAVARIAIEVYEAGLWRPIAEAPKLKKLLLFAHLPSIDNFEPVYGLGNLCSDNIWYWNNTRLDKPWHLLPTHFMHLPKPPKDN
jgi:hypothetical protein